nr:transglycosylase SLT domain-containing protein [Pseudonocardia acidicola]
MWNDLVAVINRESGFNNTAQNPTSTAYGIFQFLDSTWGAYGAVKTSDPHAQAMAGLRYIAQRYGSPAGALAHENAFGWYDSGGLLQPGLTLAFNGTGRPEPVFTGDEFDQMVTGTQGRGGDGSGLIDTLRDEIRGLRKDLATRPSINVYPREAQSEESIAAMVQRRFEFQARIGL